MVELERTQEWEEHEGLPPKLVGEGPGDEAKEDGRGIPDPVPGDLKRVDPLLHLDLVVLQGLVLLACKEVSV